jgi:Ca-activated chloride channel family protein
MLDELQPVAQDKQTFRPQRALFYWPLGAAMLLAGLLMLPIARRR